MSYGSCTHEKPSMDKMKSIITFHLNSFWDKSAYLNLNVEKVFFPSSETKKECNLCNNNNQIDPSK